VAGQVRSATLQPAGTDNAARPCQLTGMRSSIRRCIAHHRLAAKEAMLTRLGATLTALHEQHTALTQVRLSAQ